MPLLKIDSSIRICSGFGVQRVRTGSGGSGFAWLGLVWKISDVWFSMEEMRRLMYEFNLRSISKYM